MIEISHVYFLISFLLLYLSIKMRPKKFQSSRDGVNDPNRLAKKYIKHLINQMNFSIEKEKLEKESLNIKTLLPNVNNYDPSVIPSMTIVYATQSNTAKRFAEKIHKDSQVLKIKALVRNISEITLKDIETNILMVFLVSTYGEGGPSDDAIEFDKFLDKNKSGIKKDDSVYLGDFHYCIFGLGSRKYEHFCEMGKKLDRVFKKSGSIRICDLGEGDDSKNIQSDFDRWYSVFWEEIYKNFSANRKKLSDKRENSEKFFASLVPEIEIQLVEGTSVLISQSENALLPEEYEYFMKRYLTSSSVRIKSIEELRKSNKNGSTLKIVYDLTTSSELNYQVADNIGVYPNNPESLVKAVAAHLNFDLTKVVLVKKLTKELKTKISLPSGFTVEKILTSVIDLSGPITKDLIEKLLKYCLDENQYDNLQVLLMREGQWREFLLKNYNILDFLKKYDRIKIPFLEFYTLMPKIAPRFYTVASSQNFNPNHLEIIISLVLHESLGLKRWGLTSAYFKNLFDNGDHLHQVVRTNLVIRESSFRIPLNSNPLLMISTGTGIAPFISFFQEFETRKKNQLNINHNYLFFGSRNRDSDFIYENDLINWQTQKIISELFLSFSRDQEKKFYVQDKLTQESSLVIDLILTKKCHIFICGGVSMGNEVVKVLHQLVKSVIPDPDLQNRELKDLESRTITELWG